MDVLDEKGYVFIDGNNNPFHVKIWCDDPWLFYWHPDKKWVSIRRLNGPDVMIMGQNKISESEAKIYHDLNDKDLTNNEV